MHVSLGLVERRYQDKNSLVLIQNAKIFCWNTKVGSTNNKKHETTALKSINGIWIKL